MEPNNDSNAYNNGKPYMYKLPGVICQIDGGK